MKNLSEQDLAALLDRTLITRRSTPAVIKMRLRLKENTGELDEVQQFKILQRFCREDSSLDRALQKIGLPSIASLSLQPVSPEAGRLIQAFNRMLEIHWDGFGGSASSAPANTEQTEDLYPKPVKGGINMQVRILAGKDLVIRDLFTSDPYCVLQYKDDSYDVVQRFKTTVKRNTLNPFWKENFTFQGVTPEGTLHVEVWDKDRGDDDFMGRLKIPMASLSFSQESHQWYPLKEVESGMLRIQIIFPR